MNWVSPSLAATENGTCAAALGGEGTQRSNGSEKSAHHAAASTSRSCTASAGLARPNHCGFSVIATPSARKTSAPELQKSLKKIGKKTVMIDVVKAWLPQ